MNIIVEESGAMEELAGSWLSLIIPVSACPRDCDGLRRNSRGEGYPRDDWTSYAVETLITVMTYPVKYFFCKT